MWVLFFVGLLFGSFLNVLIDRLAKNQSLFFPSSHCDHCKKPLAWYDLLPLASFFLLRGRCRHCQKPISWQYPVVELVTGILFAFTALFVASPLGSRFATPQGWPDGLPWGGILEWVFMLFIVSSFVVIFFTDLKYGIIPDKVIFPAIGVCLLYFFLIHNSLFMLHLVSGLGAFLFFLAIYLLTKGRGMGFGDVKLAFLLGLFFGFPNIAFVVYIAFLTGAFVSIILMISKRKKLKETIAFGPFLVAASLLVFFFENSLANLIVWILPELFANKTVDLP